MNATEITSKASARINRIRKIGTFLKTTFFIATLLFWFLGIAYIVTSFLNPDNFVETWRFAFFAYAAECVLAYKLFSFYIRGDLFAADAVRYIRGIGIIALLIGIAEFYEKFAQLLSTNYFVGCWSLKGVFSLSIGVPLEMLSHFWPGLVIIFFAWIMDEGRKIQEEQELTV
jgi:hypothetical protein